MLFFSMLVCIIFIAERESEIIEVLSISNCEKCAIND